MKQFTNRVEDTVTMFRATVLNDKQLAVVQQIIDALKKNVATNEEIRAACQKLFAQKYAPYFIYRNVAIKTKDHKYDLSKLHSKSQSVKSPRVKREKSPRVESQNPPVEIPREIAQHNDAQEIRLQTFVKSLMSEFSDAQ
jgi:hypothetical protein